MPLLWEKLNFHLSASAMKALVPSPLRRLRGERGFVQMGMEDFRGSAGELLSLGDTVVVVALRWWPFLLRVWSSRLSGKGLGGPLRSAD